MAQRKKAKKEPLNLDDLKYPVQQTEETEPPAEADCCDRCLFASFGYALLWVGMLVLFFSEREHKYLQHDLSYVQSHLQVLDVASQKTGDVNTLLATVVEEGYPLHFTEQMSDLSAKDMIVMDDRTDLSYPGMALLINTEMYQWVETQELVRKDASGHATTNFSYSKQWSKQFHDSSNFRDKENYYNPQPTVSKLAVRDVWADDIVIGHNQHAEFHLTKALRKRLSQPGMWTNVTHKIAEYSEVETWETRSGYLYRSYDKAESYYAESDDSKSDSNSDSPGKTENTDSSDSQTESDSDSDSDSDSEKEEILKREKLSIPRTMIGDIRMTVLCLDARGKKLSYLGGLEFNADWNQYFLKPWVSPNNHEFVMLEYDVVSVDEALSQLSNEEPWKLWLSRGFTFLFMCIGFAVLPNVLYSTILVMKLPLAAVGGQVPIVSWLMYFVASILLGALLWVVVIMIAYVVGIIHLALTIIALIAFGLLINNKAVDKDEDSDADSDGDASKNKKKSKKSKKDQ